MRLGNRRKHLLGKSRWLVIAVLAAVLSLSVVGTALAADQWKDITNDQWQQTYGISAAQAAQVAQGFPDGTFHPYQSVTRAQFAKMVVDGLGIPTANPATATFTDVLPGHFFYSWIEGASAAGIISGYPDGTFRPGNLIMRQQSNSLLGRYLSGQEIESLGGIQGASALYPTLAAWYAAEGPALLAQFSDAGSLLAVHAPATAYLVLRGVIVGGTSVPRLLHPTASVNRAQAVAMVTRTGVAEEAFMALAVTSLSPIAGPPAGGTQVTITGRGFLGATAVKFGAIDATAFTVDSATQITATAPAQALGQVDVTVTTALGTTPITAADQYTYVGVPTITSINPVSGPAAGGTSVVITGTNFVGVTSVAFGTTIATAFTVNSATQITATAPAHAAGQVDVQVTAGGGATAITAADHYTYTPGPTITSLSPTFGSTAGGNQVVITGTGFVGVSGVAAVKFGTVNATSYIVNSATQITAIAPAHAAGTFDVSVTASGGTTAATLADLYTYADGPAITNVSPAAGPLAGGNQVIITGVNFVGVTSVKFGVTNATSFTVNSATQIMAVAPAHAAGAVDISVVGTGGTSPTDAFDRYTYVDLPTIQNVNPAFGPIAGANPVVITGTNFVGVTAVRFGAANAPSFTVNSATQITAVAPAHAAGQVDVSVVAGGGTSAITLLDHYTYVAAPTITSLVPTSGSNVGGTSVVITGTDFVGVSGAAAVKFGATNATSYVVNSATQITAVSPAHAAGTVDVSVVAAGGTSANTAADDYLYVTGPAITSLTPNAGPLAGGNQVVIHGANLTGVTEVRFGANVVAPADYTVDSATQITVTVVPAGIAGTVDVQVTAAIGTTPNTAADDYTYVGVPTITSLAPTSGSTAGGTSVVITGTGFVGVTGAASVTFGGVNATSYVLNTSTQITAVAPAGVAGTVNVQVIAAGGTSANTGADDFLYVAPPTVTLLNPTGGSNFGGTSVVITGTGFVGVSGAAAVKFGATNATSYIVDSATQITALAPAHVIGLVQVSVIGTGGTSANTAADDYTYVVGPAITSLSPNAGPLAGATSVVITGTSFVGVTAVAFGGTAATSFVVDSATQITAVSPVGVAGTVQVQVTAAGGATVNTAADDYTYVGVPTITSLAPASGSTVGGTSVVITGTGFAGLTGATAVTFGGVNATSYIVNSVTQITAVAPAGVAGTVNVQVIAAGGTSANTGADDYLYAAPPTITSLSLVVGPTLGGNPVIITGTNFVGVSGAAAVKFGATNATSYIVDSATQITAIAPAHVIGLVQVSVIGTGGVTGNTAADDYTYAVSGISGHVQGQTADSGPVDLPGALVTVTLDFTDPLFVVGAPDNNIVGTATADASGNYTVSTASFRGGPLPIPTSIIISAVLATWNTVTQFGPYDRASVVCSFENFTAQGYGNRRLPVDDQVTPPPTPFEHLLPNFLTAP